MSTHTLTRTPTKQIKLRPTKQISKKITKLQVKRVIRKPKYVTSWAGHENQRDLIAQHAKLCCKADSELEAICLSENLDPISMIVCARKYKGSDKLNNVVGMSLVLASL